MRVLVRAVFHDGIVEQEWQEVPEEVLQDQAKGVKDETELG